MRSCYKNILSKSANSNGGSKIISNKGNAVSINATTSSKTICTSKMNQSQKILSRNNITKRYLRTNTVAAIICKNSDGTMLSVRDGCVQELCFYDDTDDDGG